ncbi:MULTISPECIES: hypothetical protein [Spirosoma]|uniref:Uncharacterized protein n=1 Tax=Spirosoma liriopis TaxID=2937440 RepID=A0ABT0HNM4_9BACT|nr:MULTISPECIES: hypothetical protein [Spirosoma]MCK8493783.1 hypothetical protein [Spirosoma liriopis]UHG90131.1 hypothetical protein LQ777_17985 [Spirosoma oryzicola]
MRQHNKYLVKVQEELSVYQKYLLDDKTELTPTQFETYEKIDTVRAWLRAGHSDQDVLSMLKNTRSIQDRRAREILTLAYEVFAELRQSKNKEGVKYMYAEIFRSAAFEAKQMGDLVSFGILMDKAAKIDGAYDNQKVVDNESKKKPTKVVFKIKSVTVAPAPVAQNQIQDISHEEIR